MLALLANLPCDVVVVGIRWRPFGFLLNMNYAIPSIMLGIALLFASAEFPKSIGSALLTNSVTLLIVGGRLTYLCFPFFAVQSGCARFLRCRRSVSGPRPLRHSALLVLDLPSCAVSSPAAASWSS